MDCDQLRIAKPPHLSRQSGGQSRWKFAFALLLPALALARLPADDDRPTTAVKTGARNPKAAAESGIARAKPVDIASTVLTPEGKPAARAKVALVEVGRQVVIRDGDLDETRMRCPRQNTDDAGRFHFATEAEDFWLVISHPSGVAQIKCLRDSPPTIIKLVPWAHVEGTYRVARQPKANVDIDISWHVNLMVGPHAAQLFTRNLQTTDRNGRFLFERVMPGEGRIGSRRKNVSDPSEITSTCSMEARFVSGKTIQIDFGASGRPVIGQFKRPHLAPEIPWSLAYVSVHADPPLRGADLNFTATVKSKGDFCIDDVPAGKYWLNVWFSRVGGGRLAGHRFVVPEISEKLWQRSVDLGVLPLSEEKIPGPPVFKK